MGMDLISLEKASEIMQCSGLDALCHRLPGEGRQWEQHDGSDCEMGGALAVMVTVRVLLTFRIRVKDTEHTAMHWNSGSKRKMVFPQRPVTPQLRNADLI